MQHQRERLDRAATAGWTMGAQAASEVPHGPCLLLSYLGRANSRGSTRDTQGCSFRGAFVATGYFTRVSSGHVPGLVPPHSLAVGQGWRACSRRHRASGHGVVLCLQKAWLLWKASQFLWLKVFRQRPLEKVMCSPRICATGCRRPAALITMSGCQQLHKTKETSCCSSLPCEGSALLLPALLLPTQLPRGSCHPALRPAQAHSFFFATC